jgi:hypothetical protein
MTLARIEMRRNGFMFKLGVVGASVAIAALLAGSVAAAPRDNAFTVTNLVADSGSSAASDDVSLVNGWGLSAGPTTPWWVSDNGTNLSTLYAGTGGKQALTVTVAGGPTGTVFNGSATDFVVTQNGKSGAARFLFATEAGTILGWSPTVNGTTAIPGVDRSSKKTAYKGLATMNDRLYATDFHNNRVDVFDASFKLVPPAGAFRDPKLPKGYAPFGIQALSGRIFAHVREAGQGQARRCRGRRARLRRRVHPGREARGARRVRREEERAPECSLGAGARPVEFRAFLRRRAGRELRQRPDQRLRAPRRQMDLQRSAEARRRRQVDRHRWSLGDRVRERLCSRADDVAVPRRRAGRGSARALRLEHGRPPLGQLP